MRGGGYPQIRNPLFAENFVSDLFFSEIFVRKGGEYPLTDVSPKFMGGTPPPLY